MAEKTSRADLVATARTLAIAIAGALAFLALGLPVPWLSGPAASVGATAIAGVHTTVVPQLRWAAVVFLGATMGAAVSPQSLALMAQWPVSLAGLVVAVALIMVSVSTYLERVHGMDRATARLAAIPGALPLVMALTEQCTADARKVMIIQMLRLGLLLVFLPSLLAVLRHQAGALPPFGGAGPVAIWEIVVLLAAGAATAWGMERLGVPAAALFGPMLAGAILFGSGLLASTLPVWLVVPGLVIIGATVGANFAGTDWSVLRTALLAGLGSVMVGSLAALAVAATVGTLLDIPPAKLWLAYAPGGVDVMTVMAMALGFDPAFIGGHHLVRFLGLGLLAPLWLRGVTRRPDRAP